MPALLCQRFVLFYLLLAQTYSLPVFQTQFVMTLHPDQALLPLADTKSALHTELQSLATNFHIHINNITIKTS